MAAVLDGASGEALVPALPRLVVALRTHEPVTDDATTQLLFGMSADHRAQVWPLIQRHRRAKERQ